MVIDLHPLCHHELVVTMKVADELVQQSNVFGSLTKYSSCLAAVHEAVVSCFCYF